MISKQLVFLVIGIVAFSYKIFAEPAYHEMDLAEGEQRSLPITTKNTLHVNRKSIVDVEYIEDGLWRVTGVKRGVALITEKSSAGQEIARILVRVAHDDNLGKSTVFGSEEIEKFLCSAEGVTCNLARYTLTGATTSFQWYRLARELCLKHSPCVFNVSLAREGTVSMTNYYKERLTPWFRVVDVKGGVVYVESPCAKEDKTELVTLADHLSEGAVGRHELLVGCAGSFAQESFLLKARIFVLEKGEAEKFGLGLEESVAIKSPQIVERVYAFLRQNNSRVIAEPIIKLAAGVKGNLTSGGELRQLSEGEKVEEHWKRIGLSMTATANPLGDGRVRVQYQIELSTPHPFTDNRVLELNALTSLVDLTYDRPEIVGAMETKTVVSSRQIVPYINEIPIVGPLMRNLVDSEATNKIYLWIEIIKSMPPLKEEGTS